MNNALPKLTNIQRDALRCYELDHLESWTVDASRRDLIDAAIQCGRVPEWLRPMLECLAAVSLHAEETYNYASRNGPIDSFSDLAGLAEMTRVFFFAMAGSSAFLQPAKKTKKPAKKTKKSGKRKAS